MRNGLALLGERDAAMKNVKLSSAMATLAMFVTFPLSLAAEPSAPLLKVGFVEKDITPKIGMEQPGGYGKSIHRTFHDACKVRVAVFDDGKKRAAIVGLDALMVPRHLVLSARKAIEQRCGIASDAVLIGASHSHSSGPMGMVQPGQFDHASTQVKYLAYEKTSLADAGYLKQVEQAIVDGVCEANDKRVEAQCGVASGIEDKIAFNRRFRMKNGLTYTHPGRGNPDIVERAGPIDPEVGVIGAWDANGKLLGCIVNYACHATTSPGGISANWIHYLEKTIQGALQREAVVVFLAGASGDVTQVDNLSKSADPSGERQAEIVGGRVGAEAVKVMLTMQRGPLGPVDYRMKTATMNRRIPSPERVKQCLELVGKDPKEVGATEWTFAKEIVLLDALIAKEPTAEVEVQAVQVGPAVFLTNPAEYFCQFGLDIKKGSKFPFTYPVELANGCVGYVPTEEALGDHGGGYETRLTSYSNLEPAAGRKMAEMAIELSTQLKPGALPPAPPAKSYVTPWGYGNVPPELQ